MRLALCNSAATTWPLAVIDALSSEGPLRALSQHSKSLSRFSFLRQAGHHAERGKVEVPTQFA